MSIYDQRDGPAYAPFVPATYVRKYERWWSADHDRAIVDLIHKYQWNWYWKIHEKIEPITPQDIFAELSAQKAWYNKVMQFAIARAHRLELTKSIRQPRRKTCPLCSRSFVEDSLPFPLMERFGAEGLDFCAPCLKELVFQRTGSDTATRGDICAYLLRLTVLLEKIPSQGFSEGGEDFIALDFNKRLELLQLLKASKPSTSRVKAVFGSWLKALIEAGVLVDGTRETPRGTQTTALDGHVCLSLGEKNIDDYLYARQIPHQREPKYPDCNYRADFLVGEIFIEYFGLAGDSRYDARIEEKTKLCKQHGIDLIAIYPSDLIAITTLEKKLGRISAPAVAGDPGVSCPRK
jgi:hypothetical protein